MNGNLASSLSHELNTPLNGLLGAIGLMKEDLETIPIDELQELIGYTEASALRLEKLAKKFLIYLELELVTHQKKPRNRNFAEESHAKFSASAIEKISLDAATKAGRIVEQVGGEVIITSIYNQETTVEVLLPLLTESL
ncbi:hypothetical protein H6G50_10190 [Oscillatoria sp. FACHB-1406]|nr:hypothetical protein [Oscillatoria sp. FACHB-1406]